MSNLDTYPLITVKWLGKSRDFFVKYFGMRLVFEASWVVMLARKEGGPIVLGLMTAEHPSKPPGPETFDGKGMIMTFQVEGRGADYLWAGVMVQDPSGILVDVVEQIEPAAGFWDQCMG